jgi:hypothetical protein
VNRYLMMTRLIREHRRIFSMKKNREVLRSYSLQIEELHWEECQAGLLSFHKPSQVGLLVFWFLPFASRLFQFPIPLLPLFHRVGTQMDRLFFGFDQRFHSLLGVSRRSGCERCHLLMLVDQNQVSYHDISLQDDNIQLEDRCAEEIIRKIRSI